MLRSAVLGVSLVSLFGGWPGESSSWTEENISKLLSGQ